MGARLCHYDTIVFNEVPGLLVCTGGGGSRADRRRSRHGLGGSSEVVAAARPAAPSEARARAHVGAVATVPDAHRERSGHARAWFRAGTLLPDLGKYRSRPESHRLGALAGRRSAPAGAGLRLVSEPPV